MTGAPTPGGSCRWQYQQSGGRERLLKARLETNGHQYQGLALALPSAAVITKRSWFRPDRWKTSSSCGRNRGEPLHPVALDEVNLDFQVIGPAPNSPDDVEVLIAASRKEKIEDRVAAAESAGLKAMVVDIESFAIQTAFELIERALPDNGKDQNIAIVDVGTTMMNLNVLRNGQSIYMREQPFGGNTLTQEIQRASVCRPRSRSGETHRWTARQLRRGSAGTLHGHIGPRSSARVQFFFTSTQFNQVNHILLAGGCAAIPGIDEVVTRRTSVPSMVANPFANMALSSKIRPKNLATDAPSLMVACGLAMRRFDA
jgi:type IV pilus assembly protein PilM